MTSITMGAPAAATFPDFDPLPPDAGILARKIGEGSGLLALDSSTRVEFIDADGRHVHRYDVPDDSDLQNCGGYLDKILQYRSPELLAYLREAGVTVESFTSGRFPLLGTRSPMLDLAIHRLIRTLRKEHPRKRVSLFDLGCTVGEHFDLLDTMIRAESTTGETAADLLSYCGLDIAPLVLCAARELHRHVAPENFRLLHAEGSTIDLPDGSFDISLSVGVINSLGDPIGGTRKLIRLSRVATVLALWVADIDDGLWATSHRTTPTFLFGRNDLKALADAVPERRLLVADFIPEALSTQQSHFVGIDPSALASMGCYHLVVTSRSDVFPDFSPMVF